MKFCYCSNLFCYCNNLCVVSFHPPPPLGLLGDATCRYFIITSTCLPELHQRKSYIHSACVDECPRYQRCLIHTLLHLCSASKVFSDDQFGAQNQQDSLLNTVPNTNIWESFYDAKCVYYGETALGLLGYQVPLIETAVEGVGEVYTFEELRIEDGRKGLAALFGMLLCFT